LPLIVQVLDTQYFLNATFRRIWRSISTYQLWCIPFPFPSFVRPSDLDPFGLKIALHMYLNVLNSFAKSDYWEFQPWTGQVDGGTECDFNSEWKIKENLNPVLFPRSNYNVWCHLPCQGQRPRLPIVEKLHNNI